MDIKFQDKRDVSMKDLVCHRALGILPSFMSVISDAWIES